MCTNSGFTSVASHKGCFQKCQYIPTLAEQVPIHTSIGFTGVIKEALMLSFLLIPGKAPALVCFLCRHRCTTSLRLLDA